MLSSLAVGHHFVVMMELVNFGQILNDQIHDGQCLWISSLSLKQNFGFFMGFYGGFFSSSASSALKSPMIAAIVGL